MTDIRQKLKSLVFIESQEKLIETLFFRNMHLSIFRFLATSVPFLGKTSSYTVITSSTEVELNGKQIP